MNFISSMAIFVPIGLAAIAATDFPTVAITALLQRLVRLKNLAGARLPEPERPRTRNSINF